MTTATTPPTDDTTASTRSLSPTTTTGRPRRVSPPDGSAHRFRRLRFRNPVRALPHLGLVPLFIIWFGISELPKYLLIALGVLFPLYLNTASGFRQTDPKLLESARVLGFSFTQRLRTVVLPAAAAALFVGLRQASAAAWLTLIVAEQVNARQGIGFMINNARDFYRTDIVIFGLIIYATLGLLTDALIRRWERHVFRYRVGAR